MSKIFTLKLLVVFIFLGSWVQAQSVWPGDVNNNGEVNCMDVLYWSVTYGKTGAARASTTTAWQAQPMASAWNWSFPTGSGGNGMNYAYADANGDGKIDNKDATNAIEANFWKTHGTITPDKTSRIAETGATSLDLKPNRQTANGGETITVDLELNGNDAPTIPAVGIAFVIEYNPELVVPNSFTYEKVNGTVITANNSYGLGKNNSTTGIIEVATALVSGENFSRRNIGKFGKFSFKLANKNGSNNLNFTVKSIAYVNKDLSLYPIQTNPAKIVVTGIGGNDDDDNVTELPNGFRITFLGTTNQGANSIWRYKVEELPNAQDLSNWILELPECVGIVSSSPGGEQVSPDPNSGLSGIKWNIGSGFKQGEFTVTLNGHFGLGTVKVAAKGPDVKLGTIPGPKCGGNEPGPCPQIVAPVCGSDGKTYLNSCYAERAGVSYTPGVCNPDCVDPTRINPNTVCPEIYQPVCGCNGETYSNPCKAEAAGVRSYTSGPCNNNTQCYDPSYVITAAYTEVANNGVIVFSTPATNDPVCGCNGVTYKNSYVAESNGITFYTKGNCSTTCVDPAQMNPNANCTQEYEPVCGCNGITYANDCIAEAAGVVAYTTGVCGGGGSAWCNKATPLDCGNFLSGETTVGAGNNINSYPCSGKNYSGPERVYIINKTSAGDLQIGLEILTANLDLDLFLLKADCNQIVCLKSSTTSNTQTNNEGILLEDAPTGTYYLVVDGPAAGQFHLELSCGYLYCGDAIPLTCGENYNGKNHDGHDDVSLYGCGNVYNVENNGPEKVHYFTLMQAGEVSISLTNLSANLELFLLKDCDRGSCLAFSQNSGNSNESITVTLPAGTYYVVVDGYNGATSNYRLRVDCATASCNLGATLTAINANCGQNNGGFKVNTTGGNPTYIISWSGPVSGTKNTQSNNTIIDGLPAGDYQVTITDSYGCKVQKQITIGSGGNIGIQTTITNASCGQLGKVKVTVSNGTVPFKVYLSGTASGTYTVQNTIFTLEGLQPGEYHLYIVDANGCSASKNFTITQGGGNFSFTATPTAAACENPGSITIKTVNGSAPYKVYITGPKSGSVTVNANNFTIQQLPGGTYTIKIVEASGCSYTTTVTIPTTDLLASISTIDGNCEQPGSIKINISSGKPSFMITWDGPGNNDGNATTSSTSHTIPNLPAGSYTITIKDGNWCMITKVVTISGGTSNLAVELVPERGVCETPGSIGVDIIGGKAPYKVTWDGPGSNDGNTTTSNTWFSINNLPAGEYKFTIKDANGCTVMKTTTILSPESNIILKLTVNEGACGQTGSIWVDVDGGTPVYKITWQGPVNGSADSNSDKYEIKNLPPGTYTIKAVDGNWCTITKTIVVTGGTPGFTLELVPKRGICETPGSIGVDIIGGKAPYKIDWDGPGSNDGSTTTSATWLDITNLPPGSYTVTVKDANGCIVKNTTQLLAPEGNIFVNLTVNEGNCGQPSTILVDVDGGMAIYKISWQGPVNGSVDSNSDKFEIKNLPPGTYTIKVVDKNWCTVTKTIVVTGGAPGFDIKLTPINGICETPGSIKVKMEGGKAPYKITWEGPGSNDGSTTTSSTTYDINNLPKGDYTVTVKDSNNCVVTKSTSVLVGENSVTFITTIKNATCLQSGSILVDVNGGTAPYTITWDGPGNNDGNITTNNDKFEIKDLVPGSYTIKVVDKNWCSFSKTVTVGGNTTDVDIVLTPTNGVCESPGSIKVKILTGIAPFKITWEGPGNNDGSTTTSSTTYDINNLPAGSYTISVKDANGCEETKSTQISIPESNLILKLTVNEGNCGQPSTILVDVDGGMAIYKISWQGPVSGSVDSNSDKFEIKNLPPGTYTIKVVDKNWCTITKTIVVTGGAPGFDIKLTPTNGICESPGSIKVKIEGGKAPYKITWEGPGSNDGSTTTSSTMYDINNLPAGSYTVTVKDANGCEITKTTQISIPEGNLQISVTAINSACGQNGSIKVNVSGGTPNYIIEWNGAAAGSTTTGSNNFTISNLPAGSYTIKVTDSNWCTTSKVVSVASTPAILFTATPTHGTCDAPGSIKLNLTSGTAPYSITWTGNATPVMTTGLSYVINNLAAGTYTVKVTDAQGCMDTKTVTINANQSNLAVEATLHQGNCGENSKVWISITGGTPKYKIAWEGPQSGSVQINTNGYELTNLPAGKYTITITDANWCTVSTMITVIHSSGDLFKTQAFNGVCESPGSIKLSFVGGMPVYNVSWTGPTPGAGSTADTIFILQNLSPGTYTIKVTDKKGCTETETVVLDQNESDIDFDAALIINECGQYNTVWINIHTGMPTYTIKWDGPGSQDGSGTTNGNGFEIPNLPPGKYTITILDKNWCYSDTMITIHNTPIDIFSATVTNGSCNENGAIKLNFTGMAPYQVKWQGPKDSTVTVNANMYTISNLPAGDYILTVTDSKGCTEKDTVTINGGDGLLAEISSTNGNCSADGKIEVSINAGTGPFSIIISGAGIVDTVHISEPTDVVIADLQSGNYTVTVKGAGGCFVTKEVIITITESVLEITATPTSATCGATGKIVLNISGGNAPYTISWSGQGVSQTATTSNSTFTIPDLLGGNYAIKVKDNVNCETAENVKINSTENSLQVSATVTNGTCGQSGQVLVSATGGTGPFIYKWSGPSNGSQTVNTPTYTVANLSSGTYNITVTDGGGCSNTKMVSVTNNNQAPVANFSFTVNNMGVTFVNQSTPGTYQWNFDDQNTSTQNNPTHTYLQTGTFNVCLKVTNSCGSKELCKTVTIGTPNGVVNIDIEDGAGAKGEIIYIPVVIKNCVTNTLVSFAGSLQIENTNVAVITGILPGSISPQFAANNNTFSYYANNGSGIPCGVGQILFYVAVELKGNSGASTVLQIVNNPLGIEVGGLSNGIPTSIPHLITGGLISIQNIAVLKGEVTTYWGDALPTVEVGITSGDYVKKDTTDANGRYNIPALPMGKEYMIQPKLDGDPSNGLSTYALFAGQRFILGMQPAEIVSPYQIIAGDANCDGRFSTLDLFIIQRLIIGTSETLGNCPSWVFVKANEEMPVEFTATNVFPYHSCDTMMLMKDTTSNFIGVKVGDILGHANPQLLNIEPRSKDVLRLIAESRAYRAGEMVEIVLTSENFRQIASFQMGLSFDFNKLEFMELATDAHSPLARIALNNTRAKDGILRLSWFDPSGNGFSAKAEDQVLTLRFLALQNIDNLANLLEVNSRHMRSEAYNSQVEKMDIALQFIQTPVVEPNEQVAIGYKLHQNVPNPFNNQTVIGFDLPEDMQADLLIFDQLGRVVKTFSGNYSRGYNRVELPRETLSAGVYYYTLRTGNFAQTKSMIIFE